MTRRRVREKGEKDGRNAEGSERAVEQCGLHGLLPDRNAAGGAEAFPKKWTRKMRKKQNEANRSE